MLVNTLELLKEAQKGKYALGAFNVYNLEGLMAIVGAAEELSSPVIVQLHPIAISWNEGRMVDVCTIVAQKSTTQVAVHLDHCQSVDAIEHALNCGITSVMADGSELPYDDNLRFTRGISQLAGAYSAAVEGELGKLAGEEDGLIVSEYEAKLTDPDQAAAYVEASGVNSLAVCIGNVHGKYIRPPKLDMDRLESIRQQVSVPLVLHGASGLPAEMVTQSIALGICKFNVNTEIRRSYLDVMRHELENAVKPELVPIITSSVDAMKEVAIRKMKLFGSDHKL